MHNALLYEGQLHHCRYRPKEHRFSQNVYYLSLNLNQLAQNKNLFFSIDKWNLFSFFSKDHGRRSQKKNTKAHDLKLWAQEQLNAAGFDFQPVDIWLTCFPRLFGYAFNPISFWHCYDSKSQLCAVIAEVNNTFGETHNYVIAHKDLSPITEKDWFTSDKVFHVSPFFPVSGRYEFCFKGHPRHTTAMNISIVYFEKADNKKPIFDAQLKMTAKALQPKDTFRLIATYPLLTIMVVGNIHFQALKLWFKKATFFRKPKAPQTLTTKAIIKKAKGL